MAASALKQITTRAKAIYKKGGTWKAAIKKAGAEYRGAKKAPAKRKAAPKKRRRSVGAVVKRSTKVSPQGTSKRDVKFLAAVGGTGTLAHHTQKAKAIIAERIGWAEAAKMSAKTKTEKNKISKKITELKAQYRKFIA